MSHKVLIGFGEMMIAEEPAMRRQRGGVRRGKHEVARAVDYSPFSYCIRAPQEENHIVELLADGSDSSIGESLPAKPLV